MFTRIRSLFRNLSAPAEAKVQLTPAQRQRYDELQREIQQHTEQEAQARTTMSLAIRVLNRDPVLEVRQRAFFVIGVYPDYATALRTKIVGLEQERDV